LFDRKITVHFRMQESWYGDEAEFLRCDIPFSELLEGRGHEIIDADTLLSSQLL